MATTRVGSLTHAQKCDALSMAIITKLADNGDWNKVLELAVSANSLTVFKHAVGKAEEAGRSDIAKNIEKRHSHPSSAEHASKLPQRKD